MLMFTAKFFHHAGNGKDPATTPGIHALPDRSDLTPENLGYLVETADFAMRHRGKGPQWLRSKSDRMRMLVLLSFLPWFWRDMKAFGIISVQELQQL